MQKPYIGITGFMAREEVQSVLDIIPKDSQRLLMIGVLASQKTLIGVTNKYPNRYPHRNQIAHIFPMPHLNPSALNLVHYNTKDPTTLLAQMKEVTEVGGPNFKGFQLNMAWPPVETLLKYRYWCPWGTKIVLQVGSHAFEVAGRHSPDLLAKQVHEYSTMINYVLLDLSGGLGMSLDAKKLRPYLDALKSKIDSDIGIGVAGGLSPTTLHLIEPLLEDFPDLCIDAEGRLRDKDDNLDLNLAGDYVRQALSMFGRKA